MVLFGLNVINVLLVANFARFVVLVDTALLVTAVVSVWRDGAVLVVNVPSVNPQVVSVPSVLDVVVVASCLYDRSGLLLTPNKLEPIEFEINGIPLVFGRLVIDRS